MKRKNEPDLVSFLKRADVDVVISRIPGQFRERLRDVFFSWRSWGVRRLGSVRNKGRRDIEIYSVLPPRISLGRFLARGQEASEFGAPSRGQWPPWAVRRFLLYDVFLHELGHLQLVRSESSRWRRRYASETLAQKFSDEWRATLWSERLEHWDVVHNPPTEDEAGFLPVWERAEKAARLRLVRMMLKAPYSVLPNLGFLGDLNQSQKCFLASALCQKGRR